MRSNTVRREVLPALGRLLPLFGLIVCATAAMFLGFLLGSRPAPPPARRLEIGVVNVGQGEASWVRTPEGRFLLIGGGPPGTGARILASLRAAGARRIDLLVLPYPYTEGIGALPEVLQALPVEQALEAGYPPESEPPVNETQQLVREMLRGGGVPVSVARAGQQFRLGAVRVEVLAPGEPLLAASPGAANNSVVLRLVYGETGFLFAGGLERAGENALLARAPELSADWLRIARFGTREATSPELLRLVRPVIAVISVGRGNAGGYPHRETLERLEASGTRLYRTDTAQGDLVFWSDGHRVHGP